MKTLLRLSSVSHSLLDSDVHSDTMDFSMEHCCEVGVLSLTTRQMTFGSSAVPHLTAGALAALAPGRAVITQNCRRCCG